MTTAYIDQRIHLVCADLDKEIAAGHKSTELVGLITDGKNRMRKIGERACVVPLALARAMIPRLRDLPDLAPAIELLEAPRDGVLPIMIFVGDVTGFVAYEYDRVQVQDRPLFALAKPTGLPS